MALSTVGHPWEVNRQQLLAHFGPDFPVDEFGEQARAHYSTMSDTSLKLKPGVTELLNLLDTLGLPRAIATSSKHDTVQHHLAAHGLLAQFQTVVAQGDYAASKPSPDPYLVAAKRIGVDPASCMALEDSFAGVQSASSAGMTTIMVPDLLLPTDEISRVCDYVAIDLHEVRDLLLNASQTTSA